MLPARDAWVFATVVQDQLRVIQREQEGEGKKELGKKNLTLHQLQDAKFENNRLVEEMAAMRSRCRFPARLWMRLSIYVDDW